MLQLEEVIFMESNLTKKFEGVVFLTLGLLILFNPFGTFSTLMFIVGSIMFIYSAKRVYNLYKLKGKITKWTSKMINQLFVVLISIILIYYNQQTNMLLGIIVGSLLLYNGVPKVIQYQTDKDNPFSQLIGLFGIIISALGIVVMIFPTFFIVTLTTTMGLFFTVTGTFKLFFNYNLVHMTNLKTKDNFQEKDSNVIDVDYEDFD